MKLSSVFRILSDRGAKPVYWSTRNALGHLVSVYVSPSGRPFARHVTRDMARFLLGRVRPSPGATTERIKAAATWLMQAQDATPDDGVSYGYFPSRSIEGDWKPSYPETTGYIIPTLLDYARRYDDQGAHDRAIRMARWESNIQMPSGAVQGGMVCPTDQQTPAVFNTGMVLEGFVAAFQASGEDIFLDAGRRAADFLAADLGPDGHFQTHGRFVAKGRIKTYNCLCAWGLYRFGQDAGDELYQKAAIRTVEASVKQQRTNGWFANKCLEKPEAPLTHTIGYTLQGILEVGILASREEFIAATRKGMDPLIARMKPSGFLHGRWDANWEPSSFSSCLPGSAQIAVVCYRLYNVTGERRYREAADRLVNFLKALQVLNSPLHGINGAIAGSFPILGSYQTGGYPNWATKYLLDALMEQDRLESALDVVDRAQQAQV